MKKCLSKAVIVAALALFAGCKSFDSEWKEARQRTLPAGSIEGVWAGTWQNTNNTHSGLLQAVVSKNSETNYTAHFHATWGTHAGGFKTDLKGQWQDGTYIFAGRKRILGFLIATHGQAAPTNLFSIYESRFDNGTFTLHRPGPGEEPAAK